MSNELLFKLLSYLVDEVLAIVLVDDLTEPTVDSLSNVDALISETDMSSLRRPSSSKSSLNN